jgi:MFS family permease
MALHLWSEEARKWWTLVAVSFGLFMIMLDNTVVNVALPSMARDLGADLSELEWIVTGYALTFASLMLTGGVADAWPTRLRRRPRDSQFPRPAAPREHPVECSRAPAQRS